jgi:hypothetical protein
MKIKSSVSSVETVGSMAWGERSQGVLDLNQKRQFIENFKFVMNQEHLDAERCRLGLLNPKFISIESLTPPDSKMVKDALTFAEETHAAPLLRHSWRTYYFGALIALHDEIEFDRELGFTAAILHDIGLTGRANPRPCDCCFAISGALQTRDFLLSKGHSRTQADSIAHAIAVHMNIHVPVEEHGAIAFLVTRGAVCDVLGAGVSRISYDSTQEVLDKYSREDLYAVLGPTAFEHLADTRIDVLFKALASGSKGSPPHPLDTAPYA